MRFKCLKDNHRAIKDEIIINTDLSSRKIEHLIKNLKSKGLVKRIGSNKTGYLEMKEVGLQKLTKNLSSESILVFLAIY